MLLYTLVPQQLTRSTLFPYTTLFRSRCGPGLRVGLRSLGHTFDGERCRGVVGGRRRHVRFGLDVHRLLLGRRRSEEHTSELQSPVHLVCRLLLEKKNISRLFWFE